jgi:hypothetical protein
MHTFQYSESPRLSHGNSNQQSGLFFYGETSNCLKLVSYIFWPLGPLSRTKYKDEWLKFNTAYINKPLYLRFVCGTMDLDTKLMKILKWWKFHTYT